MTRSTFFDHTVAGFTATGSPLLVDDRHNPSSAYDYDDIDDRLHTTAIPIGTTTAYTVMMWHNPTTGSQYILNQRPASGYAGAKTAYDFGVQSNGAITFAHRENNNTKNLVSVSSTSSFSFGTWYLFGATVDLVTRDINIFVNGVETGYSTQDSQSGGPTASTNSMTRLGIGSVYNDSYLIGAKGIISRGIFEEQVLTPSQMLSEYNAEVAAIGEGFGGDPDNSDDLLIIL